MLKSQKVMMGMTENRYRIDTDCIIDQKTGEILTLRKAVNRLNRQDVIIKAEREAVQFHVDGYNQVIQTIKEAYETERTSIGKSVLKQLLEVIQ